MMFELKEFSGHNPFSMASSICALQTINYSQKYKKIINNSIEIKKNYYFKFRELTKFFIYKLICRYYITAKSNIWIFKVF